MVGVVVQGIAPNGWEGTAHGASDQLGGRGQAIGGSRWAWRSGASRPRDGRARRIGWETTQLTAALVGGSQSAWRSRASRPRDGRRATAHWGFHLCGGRALRLLGGRGPRPSAAPIGGSRGRRARGMVTAGVSSHGPGRRAHWGVPCGMGRGSLSEVGRCAREMGWGRGHSRGLSDFAPLGWERATAGVITSRAGWDMGVAPMQ